ncbi:MAG TPA: DUF5362 domain-containing protein [Clostridiaceae bacterium]|nr:DUF5362 domain-containing protein [Clostridiaceae bacterium]
MEDMNFNYGMFNDEPHNVFTIPLNMADIKSLVKWATFKAIIDIITGAITCFGIITAVIGIPQIIAGIKLLNAADELNRYISVRNTNHIAMALYNMNRFFKFSGAAIIAKICYIIIIIVLYTLLVSYMLSNGPDIFPDIFRDMPNIRF